MTVTISLIFHRGLRRLPAVACALVLTACAEYAAVETASLVLSGKTLVDHTASLITRRDCSIVYAQQHRYYCKSDSITAAPPVIEQFCYKTLGEINCYRDPEADPVSAALER